MKHRTYVLLGFGAVTAASGTPAFAQEAAEVGLEEAQSAQPAGPPPCQDSAHRAFDFWVGEWNVHTPDGQLAGVNSIQPINAGCGLIERYSVGGQLYGQSYNFYDSARGSWSQLWLSPGLIIRLEGPVGDGETLTMYGTSTYDGQPGARAFTGRWTLQQDGTVRQEFWEQNPETDEWTIWFTGIYSRTD